LCKTIIQLPFLSQKQPIYQPANVYYAQSVPMQ
jgi:hypothetical protein